MTCSLVTGGAGFLGSHVVRECLAQGHRVVVLDDLSGGSRGNVPPGVPLVQCSVTDASAVRATFDHYRPDYVYHLAAYAAEGLSPFARRFNYENNVVGSAVVINECVRFKVQRLVFTSSIAVYGHEKPPFYETDQPEPRDPYGIAKYAVELDLQAACEQFGLEYTIFRPHNVYGPYQNLGDRYRNVVGIFMRQALRGEPFTIFGDGSQTRAFSYVTPVASAIAGCVAMPDCVGEVYNVGGDHVHTVREVAVAVADAFGNPPHWQHYPARHEAQHAYCDHRKARATFAEFGEREAISLRQGVALMAQWARTAAIRSSQAPPIDLPEHLPEAWQ